jgi:hypothetical protein
MTNFGYIGDFCGPQPAFFSQKPHPAIDVLLQTKGEVQFDRAVTARSKPFFSCRSMPNSVDCHLLTADCQLLNFQ